MRSPSLSVVILTMNEERHLARALASIRHIAEAVYIVDSGSTDKTIEIAKEFGAIVVFHQFVTQATQLQWALDNLQINSEWVLRLDADEVIEPPLAKELLARLPTLALDVVGVNLKRKQYFMGRWIRFGGRYPVVLLRIWRAGHAIVEDRWMDEHIYVTGGKAITFRNPFADVSLITITAFIEKHNKYATREAIDVVTSECRLLVSRADLERGVAPFQAKVKRLMKRRVYGALPFWLAAPAYFIWRYVALLGFLDGLAGLSYHFLQGFWYRYLVGLKVRELRDIVSRARDGEQALSAVRQFTGFPVS